MTTRIKHVLVMLVAVLLLGASSQAAVCELACGLQMQAVECAGTSAGMSMAMSATPAVEMATDHSQCAHGMHMRQQPVLHQASECHDGGCSHVQVVAFDKAGAASVSFAAVKWVTVAVVPVDLNLPAHYAGVGGRPLFQSAAADPLVVSLRV